MAWLGGSHTDSRFRRGMGGTLHPEYDVGEERTNEIEIVVHTHPELCLDHDERIGNATCFGLEISNMYFFRNLAFS